MDKILNLLRFFAYGSISLFFFDLYFNESHYVVVAKEELFINIIEYISNNTYAISLFFASCILFFIADVYKLIMHIVRLNFETSIIKKKQIIQELERELERAKKLK